MTAMASGKTVDFAASWGRIHATLELLTSEAEPAPEASWLALYTDVYRICTSPMSQGVHRRLYDHLHDFLCNHCETVVNGLHAASESYTAFQFLALYARYGTVYIAVSYIKIRLHLRLPVLSF